MYDYEIKIKHSKEYLTLYEYIEFIKRLKYLTTKGKRFENVFYRILYSIEVISSHTSQSGQHKQINRQMLEKMRRKGNPSTLLVGMQTGEATVENSKEFPQKTKNGTAL